MEADGMWKTVPVSHIPWKTLRVSHSSHSPRHQMRRANEENGDPTSESVKDVAVDLSGKSPRVHTFSPHGGEKGLNYCTPFSRSCTSFCPGLMLSDFS
jgi:hypothetical protein